MVLREGPSGPIADEIAATSIIESSGPTELPIGAVADGEILKRVGNTIVGASPAGTSLVTNLAQGEVNAFPPGQNSFFAADGATPGGTWIPAPLANMVPLVDSAGNLTAQVSPPGTVLGNSGAGLGFIAPIDEKVKTDATDNASEYLEDKLPNPKADIDISRFQNGMGGPNVLAITSLSESCATRLWLSRHDPPGFPNPGPGEIQFSSTSTPGAIALSKSTTPQPTGTPSADWTNLITKLKAGDIIHVRSITRGSGAIIGTTARWLIFQLTAPPSDSGTFWFLNGVTLSEGSSGLSVSGFEYIVEFYHNGYETVEDSGAALPKRGNINFIGAGVSLADDAGNNRTNVTIAGGGGGIQPSYRLCDFASIDSQQASVNNTLARVGTFWSGNGGTVNRASCRVTQSAAADDFWILLWEVIGPGNYLLRAQTAQTALAVQLFDLPWVVPHTLNPQTLYILGILQLGNQLWNYAHHNLQSQITAGGEPYASGLLTVDVAGAPSNATGGIGIYNSNSYTPWIETF